METPCVISDVGKDTASIRTLRRALATIGSEERLAAALGCSPVDLVRWLSGERPAPSAIFIAALDIVAGAAWPRQRRQ
jgi:DNA-binding transcriptional regulator YdaS (Cro superfamily)